MNLSVLPEGVALRGPNAILWATAILQEMHAPVNNVNIGYLCGWFLREGGGGANNPMNTTLRTSGSVGSINSAGVQSYSSPPAGVDATVKTLEPYTAIVESLRAGRGIPANGLIPSELVRWSGGGYSHLVPVSVEVDIVKGVAHFRGTVDLGTGHWDIEGVPGNGSAEWGSNSKELSAEIQVSVGPDGGSWRIKGESANAKPLGK